jgi:CRP-like cAMP-binding protein
MTAGKGPPVIDNSLTVNHKLIEALKNRSLPVPCDEGRTLFIQGESCGGVYILENGEASLVLNASSGRAVMCIHTGSGSLLGLSEVVGREPYDMTAMVRKGAEVRFVSRENFEEFIKAEPWFYPDFLEVLAAEVRSARQAFSSTVG